MKQIFALLLVTLFAGGVMAADATKPAPKPVGGPNGGRVLETPLGQVEFFVQPDRRIRVTFLDGTSKPVAPQEQSVKATAQAKGGSKTLDFEKGKQAFVSREPLPEGDGYTIVLQFRKKEGEKPGNYRIVYDASECGGCKLAEYACRCEGHGH